MEDNFEEQYDDDADVKGVQELKEHKKCVYPWAVEMENCSAATQNIHDRVVDGEVSDD